MTPENKSPVDCVGVVCLRGNDVLLIRRGKPPRIGEWSIPGGRIEPGESEINAVHRELFEETQITASLVEKIETIEAQFENLPPYLLHDYVVLWESGDPIAGDDAMHAEFMPIDNIGGLNMWPETVRIIKKAQHILSEKGHFK